MQVFAALLRVCLQAKGVAAANQMVSRFALLALASTTSCACHCLGASPLV